MTGPNDNYICFCRHVVQYDVGLPSQLADTQSSLALDVDMKILLFSMDLLELIPKKQNPLHQM